MCNSAGPLALRARVNGPDVMRRVLMALGTDISRSLLLPHPEHSVQVVIVPSELHTGLLVRTFGSDATLGSIGAPLRCHRCGLRGARIEAQYVGPVGDER